MNRFWTGIFALALAGCSVLDARAPSGALPRDAAWAVLPIVNHTETPQAGARAESITEALMRAQGLADVRRYPGEASGDALADPVEAKVRETALAWAKGAGVKYAVTGAVDEWRYKVGVDGEPAVGVALSIVEVDTGRVLWSGVGAKTGWSREAVAGVAQKLIRELLASAKL